MWMILLILLILIIATVIFVIIWLDRVPPFRPEKIREKYFGTLPSTYNAITVSASKQLLEERDIDDMMIRMKISLSRFTNSQDLESIKMFDLELDVLDKFEQYNWKKEQILYKDLPHFFTNIMGLDIHFLHLKKGTTPYWSKKFACDSKNAQKVIPLLLIHGFPSSVLEFTILIPHLLQYCCNFDFTFDIVIPSIPGCGFSSVPSQEGFSHEYAALIFKILMERLGYQQFYCHGTDWNSHVPTVMAIHFPKSVKGLHLIGAYSRTGSAMIKSVLCKIIPSICPHPAGEEHADKIQFPEVHEISDLEKESVALCCSPLPLILWLLEHGHSSSSPIRREFLFKTVALYWVSNSVTCALRLHAKGEDLRKPSLYSLATSPVEVPTGICQFPDSLVKEPIDFLLGRFPNIIYWSRMKKGGSFPALDQPNRLAMHIVKFINKVEVCESKEICDSKDINDLESKYDSNIKSKEEFFDSNENKDND